MNPFYQKELKPWGYEIILTPPDWPVTGKIAFTKAGNRWSFQYHEKKTETICLREGEAEIWLEDEKGEVKKIPMEKLKGYNVKPLKKHRFCAITDCLTFEISTREEGTTYRLEDDYRRPDETEESGEEERKKNLVK